MNIVCSILNQEGNISITKKQVSGGYRYPLSPNEWDHLMSLPYDDALKELLQKYHDEAALLHEEQEFYQARKIEAATRFRTHILCQYGSSRRLW